MVAEIIPVSGHRRLNRRSHHLILFLLLVHLNRSLHQWRYRRFPDSSRPHPCWQLHPDCRFLQWHPCYPCRCRDPFPPGSPFRFRRSFPCRSLGRCQLEALGQRREIPFHSNPPLIRTRHPRYAKRRFHPWNRRSILAKTIPAH
jgi:hypothetical protein